MEPNETQGHGDASGERPASGSASSRGWESESERLRDVVMTGFRRLADATRRTLDDDSVRRAGDGLRDTMGSARDRLRTVGERVGARVNDPATRAEVARRARLATDSGVTVLHGLAVSLRGLAERFEEALEDRRTYQAGEVVDGGQYTCRECGGSVLVTAGQELPTCSACGSLRRKRTA